tara:strand:+ start:154 stop:573 length:420 start_codon:yes stop_codon:yes gene_type:complete
MTSKTPKVKDRSAMERKIKLKERELREKEERVLALSDQIKHKSNFLKQKNAHEKATWNAASRMKQHMDYYHQDVTRRSSDRSNDIRMYTKMDLSIWAYPQVREWFNKDATKEDLSYKLTPSQTGYMIKVDETYREKKHH